MVLLAIRALGVGGFRTQPGTRICTNSATLALGEHQKSSANLNSTMRKR